MTGSLWLNLPSSGLICPHQVQIEVICLSSLGVRAEGCIFLCVNVNRIKRNIIEIAPVFIVAAWPVISGLFFIVSCFYSSVMS